MTLHTLALAAKSSFWLNYPHSAVTCLVIILAIFVRVKVDPDMALHRPSSEPLYSVAKTVVFNNKELRDGMRQNFSGYLNCH